MPRRKGGLHIGVVSTHSRPKAAGSKRFKSPRLCSCFNTQPPEGGWSTISTSSPPHSCFNTQPPEGGWRRARFFVHFPRRFNTQPPEGGWRVAVVFQGAARGFQHTAARRRLAQPCIVFKLVMYGFNTQPPEGGWVFITAICNKHAVSTHSRPKAAGD